jgi:hypothetical protein
MNLTFRTLIATTFALGIAVAGGKVAHATVTCPPLCLLPPDPAPPMPPINYPDPPFKPIAPSNPNNNGKPHEATAPMAPAHAPLTITGKVQAGGECKSGNMSGTLVLTNGQYSCNFTPSKLQVGGACHAMDKIGTVTVVDGKRYCKIQP